MTVAVTKIAEDKFANVLELSKLLEDLSSKEVLFKKLPDLYIEDLKNHSIAFDYIKKALSYEEDDVIKAQLMNNVQQVITEKMQEAGIDTNSFSYILGNPYTHWSQSAFILKHGPISVLTYSIFNRGFYVSEFDHELIHIDNQIALKNNELEEIALKDTPYFKKKRKSLEEQVDKYNKKKEYLIDNREQMELIQSTFRNIIDELNQ